MKRFLNWLSAKLPHRLIPGQDGPYLSRFKIFGWMPGDERRYPFSVYLHKFHRADEDQDSPHSHPWKWALAVVLVGGYVEKRLAAVHPSGGSVTMSRELRPFALNLIRATDYHVISELLEDETWTLFIAGPKADTWFFWVLGRGPVPWRQHLRERGLEAA